MNGATEYIKVEYTSERQLNDIDISLSCPFTIDFFRFLKEAFLTNI